MQIPCLLTRLGRHKYTSRSTLTRIVRPKYQVKRRSLQGLTTGLKLRISRLTPTPRGTTGAQFGTGLEKNLTSFLFRCSNYFQRTRNSDRTRVLNVRRRSSVNLPDQTTSTVLLRGALCRMVTQTGCVLNGVSDGFIESRRTVRFHRRLTPKVFGPNCENFQFGRTTTNSLPAIVVSNQGFGYITDVTETRKLSPMAIHEHVTSAKGTTSGLSGSR